VWSKSPGTGLKPLVHAPKVQENPARDGTTTEARSLATPTRLRGGRSRAPRKAVALAALLALAGMLPTTAAGAARSGSAGPEAEACLHIDRVTPFAPRGEVYVQLRASCEPRHFLREPSRLAYVEVLVSDLPPVGDDVRVFEDAPRARQTLVFRNLSMEAGDVVLVRLLRFGSILGLQSTVVP